MLKYSGNLIKFTIMKGYLWLFILLCCASLHAQQRPLFWFIENNKMGFKDDKGITIIPPKYVFAESFSEGLACVGIGDNIPMAKYGFINEKGDWVIKPQFGAPGSFSEGLANVMKDYKWGYIDKTGKFVIEPQFQLCYGFRNGYAQVSKNREWGIIDKKGNVVVPLIYYDVTNVGDGVLGVQKEISPHWEIIDLKGTKQSSTTFSRIKQFSGGMAPARDDSDKYGFISPKGTWLISPKYITAEPFSEGLAAVEVDYGEWGFIDVTGKLVIPAEYSSHSYFVNGIAMIEKNGEYMYINKKGKVLLRFNK
jgi:hypothetical protein